MEFADVGSHCDMSTCRQQDFLPFRCDTCAGTYCLEHRSYASHDCQHAGKKDTRAIKCPICKVTITCQASDNMNDVWEQHYIQSCDPSKKNNKTRCARAGCRDVMGPSSKFQCETCRKDVCLTHRYPDMHSCQGRPRGSAGAWFGFGGGGGSTSSQPARPAAVTTKKPTRKTEQDPSNTLKGSADRRRRSFDQKRASAAEVIDLTAGDNGSNEVVTPAATTTSSSGSCPFCNISIEDPVALVEHVESLHGEQQRELAQNGGGCLVG